MNPYWEERLGALIAGGGIVWTAAVASRRAETVHGFWLSNGPLEVCAVGVLLWLHAKYRRSVRVR